MSLTREVRERISNDIIMSITQKENDQIKVASLCKKYNVTRQTIYRIINKLEKDNVIVSTSEGRIKNYFLCYNTQYTFKYIIGNTKEDEAYSKNIKSFKREAGRGA